MIKSLQYIIRFLLGEDVSRTVAAAIGYTADRRLFPKYNIVFIPSGFFDETMYGKTSSIPTLPLQEIEGIPLLFGEPKVEKVGATLVVHADIIASTYFLISRYEEMVRRSVRDEHGRFPGKESLPYRAGFIDRPIVDEYRILLRKWLQQTNLHLPEIKQEIKRIYLTHDVDAPFLYRSWKGFVRSLLNRRGIKQTMQGFFGPLENDPYYTFPFLFQQDEKLRGAFGKGRCQSIYFVKAGGKYKEDKPRYNLYGKDMRTLFREITAHQAVVGLHTSYQAGKEPSLIRKEKTRLGNATGKKITYNRHHFLACREPEDMIQLEAARITNDFTLGYADVAGFRLGTSYPVHWINPVNRRLSPLKLHPLLIMDCSLEEEKYMGLDSAQAEEYCLHLIEQCKKVGGDVNLLWHNTSFCTEADSYLCNLYTLLLNKLAQQ